jgi:alpha-tubulin suppressor-like RCC1 family protein
LIYLSVTGEVMVCGLNDFGQLGLSKQRTDREVLPTLLETVSDIKAIKTGIFHSLVLAQQGEVYSFGDNTFG